MVSLARVRFDSDSSRMLDAQQVIHHLEPFLPLRKINPAYVNDTFKLTLRVITEKGKDWDYRGRWDV
jgi:hypothetical protein